MQNMYYYGSLVLDAHSKYRSCHHPASEIQKEFGQEKEKVGTEYSVKDSSSPWSLLWTIFTLQTWELKTLTHKKICVSCCFTTAAKFAHPPRQSESDHTTCSWAVHLKPSIWNSNPVWKLCILALCSVHDRLCSPEMAKWPQQVALCSTCSPCITSYCWFSA